MSTLHHILIGHPLATDTSPESKPDPNSRPADQIRLSQEIIDFGPFFFDDRSVDFLGVKRFKKPSIWSPDL